MAWIIATKLDMTRVIKDDKFIPVTLLQVPELRVVGFKTLEKDGYEAMIIWVLIKGSEATLKEAKSTLSKNEFSNIVEFPLNEGEATKYNVWDVVGLDTLEWIETVTVEWFSKWKSWTLFSNWDCWSKYDWNCCRHDYWWKNPFYRYFC